MSAVGNDNYRPDMIPPAPLKERAGWLSSNMAQLMVFLNGVILTVTAYATLGVFIQEIVKEGFLQTTSEVQEYAASSYGKIEETLSSFNTLIKVLPKDREAVLSQYAKGQILRLTDFEEIFWVSINGNKAKITPILESGHFSDEWRDAFIQYRIPESQKNSLFIVESKYLPEDKIGAYKNVFAVVRTVNNDPNRYVVGFVDSTKLIPYSWLKKRNAIFDLQIVGEKKGVPVFNYTVESGLNEKSESDLEHYVSTSKISFADEIFNITLGLNIGKREAFLQKIPFLMLLFGVTLTLIGTLYVRNNQNQSKKLSSMNKELAHKNYELHQEMSERERLSVLIQKSAIENKAIINAVSDVIFELSDEGGILFLNDSWLRVTGFEIESSIGRNLFDFIYGQDILQQEKKFEELVKGEGSSYRSFTRLRCSDEKYRTIEIAFSMLRQDENEDVRVVGTITDVEEHRRAERALGEVEEKYRNIVENAASGIYQVTPEGQILSANPAFAKILGYDNVEDILRDVSKAQEQLYVDSGLRDKTLKEVSTLGRSKGFEVQVRCKSGEIIWVNENIRPVFDNEGTLIFYEGSMEDIDQRKQVEIALKAAKVESDLANRSKSEFLTNMSHELRTPLNSVIGFAEIIKGEAFGRIEQKEYKEYANNIFDSGNRLLSVINEILDVSHIEAGDRDLNEEIVNVKDIVASCLDMVKVKSDQKKMRIDNKVIDGSISLVGEKQAVKQMLLNLLSNAIRFSPSQSYLMLDAEIDKEERLRLSVTDTGVGLTESELEKALSPFGQVDTEHNREKSGTGLGLTLVKSLVELHGGSLEIVSQKNIGTTATLTFPKKRVSKVDANSSETV